MSEVFEATKVRVAERPPAGCAACFGQYPQRTHVDFGSSYDGPMLPAQENATGVVGVSIDELVICEECLRTAAQLLGLTDPGQTTEQLEALTAQAEELTERLAGAMAYANKLETAIAAKPKPARRPPRAGA